MPTLCWLLIVSIANSCPTADPQAGGSTPPRGEVDSGSEPASNPLAIAAIDRALEELGGREKLERTRNARFVIHQVLEVGSAETVHLTLTTRADGARRVIKKIGDKQQILARIGNKYWMTMYPEEVVAMPERIRATFEQEAQLDHLLLDFKKKGYRAVLLDSFVPVARVAFLPLEQSATDDPTPNKARYEVTFDPKSGLPSAMSAKIPRPRRRGEFIEVVTLFGEYRAIDGVRVPHRREVVLEDVVTSIATVVECRFGLKLADAVFEPPVR